MTGPAGRRWFVCAAVVALLMMVIPAPPAFAETVEEGQWYVEFLRLDDAHRITSGKGVIVGLIDTGVGQHPDLSGNVLPGKDLRTVSRDPDGRYDQAGHGTHLAGLIAGHGRITGVAPEATILPVKVKTQILGVGGDPAAGIEWAVAQGATVLCLATTTGTSSIVDQQAIERAIAADVIVIAGAGNTNLSSSVGYPARYDGVVAVGGVDRNGNHAKISVRGDAIMLAAPSDGVSSTTPDGKYAIGTGTSVSTALVAGAVALVRAKYPDLPADEVIHRLTATADDKGPAGRDDEYGYGVINIVKALTADVPPLHPATSAAAEGGTSAGVPIGLIGAVVAGVLVLVVVIVVLIARGRRNPAA